MVEFKYLLARCSEDNFKFIKYINNIITNLAFGNPIYLFTNRYPRDS